MNTEKLIWGNKALQEFDPTPELRVVRIDTDRLGQCDLPSGLYEDGHLCVVSNRKLNDIRYINKFLESANALLEVGDMISVCGEISAIRKSRIMKRYPQGIGRVIHVVDFIVHRVLPKLYLTKRPYFALTGGKRRAITLSEMIGRLICCGFKAIEYQTVAEVTHILAEKQNEPTFDPSPSYGPLFTMRRVGKGGKLIDVYKVRTMHPYSEYVQEFIFECNGLHSGGKIKDDFRITSWGKFLRKWWLDELPMLLNVCKGDLKIVGVRPLSEHYLSLYPDDLRALRMLVKPGLLPPFYADLPGDLEEITDSERRYLLSYFAHPWRTDLIYMIRIVRNILKGARSH